MFCPQKIRSNSFAVKHCDTERYIWVRFHRENMSWKHFQHYGKTVMRTSCIIFDASTNKLLTNRRVAMAPLHCNVANLLTHARAVRNKGIPTLCGNKCTALICTPAGAYFPSYVCNLKRVPSCQSKHVGLNLWWSATTITTKFIAIITDNRFKILLPS